MRATWLTDIHLNMVRPLALKAFYERVRAEQPDVVLVTGDIGESDSVARLVGELATIAPLYFVLGNHDYYRSSVATVRAAMQRLAAPARWLHAVDPIALTDRVALVGVDGWGDARCGDLDSKVELSDWIRIDELKRCHDRAQLVETLQRYGSNEARTLRDKLARAPARDELLVLTHVPPFPEACIYDGKQSDAGWLPWFTCIATGEVLADHARAHPEQRVTVLCGHSHGVGAFEPLPNLIVRTGGWPPGVEGYGNPIVQATFELS